LVLDTIQTRLDGSSFEIEIEFLSEDQNGKTLMTMIQRGFPTPELRDEHGRGLPNAFLQLQRIISSR